MSQELLSEKEAQALFNKMSSAVRSGDVEKLDELTDVSETPEVEDASASTPDETPAGDQPAGEQEVKPEQEGDSPPDKEADKPDDKVVDKDKQEDKVQPEVAKLMEELEKAKKEAHALRSQAGRVPSLQSRVNQIDRQLEELKKLHTSPTSQPSAKIKPKLQEKLAKLRETDPELADLMLETMSEATDGVANELRSAEITKLEALRTEESKAYEQHEADRLLQMYPNAPEVFQSSHWAEWKKTQSPVIQSAARSNNADDVALAFEKFAEDMAKQYPELVAKDEPKVEVPAVETDEQKKAKQVEAERQRKKQATAVVGSPNANGKVEVPNDPEALFKKFSEEARKRRLGE